MSHSQQVLNKSGGNITSVVIVIRILQKETFSDNVEEIFLKRHLFMVFLIVSETLMKLKQFSVLHIDPNRQITIAGNQQPVCEKKNRNKWLFIRFNSAKIRDNDLIK